MVSPTAAKQLGDGFGLHPVGTAPFIFKEWQRNSPIIVERNPNYWDPEKPYLDRVVFHLLANSTVGIPRMLTGELDGLSSFTKPSASTRRRTGRAACRQQGSPLGFIVNEYAHTTLQSCKGAAGYCL